MSPVYAAQVVSSGPPAISSQAWGTVSLMIFLAFLIEMALCHLCGRIMTRARFNYWLGFLLGLYLGPVLGLLIVFVVHLVRRTHTRVSEWTSRPATAYAPAQDPRVYRSAPTVPPSAAPLSSYGPTDGSSFKPPTSPIQTRVTQDSSTSAQVPTPVPGGKVFCPNCGSGWNTDYMYCGDCGALIPPPAST